MKNQPLNESEEKYRNLIQKIRAGVIVHDADTKIILSNSVAQTLLGLTEDQLMGKTAIDPDWHFLREDGTRMPIEEYPVNKIMATRQPMRDVVIGIHQPVHKDITWVLVNGDSVPDQKGNISETIITFIDITDRIRINAINAQEISEKKRLEKELLRASVYNRSLIEASLDPLVTISAEGKITDVNEATEKVTGRTRLELTGTDFSDYFTEPEKAREGYQQVFARGFVTDYPLAIRHKDEHITDVLYNASVYRDEAGTVLGVFAAARNVTERKRAEEVLRSSEKALREAQRIGHLGSWHMDLATNEVYWSEVLYEMYGFDPALPPPLYTESMKLFTPESWERLSSSIAHTTETGIPYELELELVRKDGGRGWMLARGELVLDAHNTPVKVQGIVMDITKRKQAEEKVRESEQKFRAMTDTSPLAIYMSSGIEQTAEYINPTFTRLFGYTLEEVPTAAQWWPLAYPDEKYREQVEKEWQRKVEQAIKTKSEIEPMEVIVTCKDGSRRNILWGFISTGVQNWAFGLDMTERKHAEDALREKEERLALATVKNGVGVWDWNLQTQKMIWDDSMYALYHIRREDFSGTEEAWRASLHPEDLARGDQEVEDAIAGRKPFETEFRVVWPGGEVRYIKAVAKVFPDEHGRPLRMLGINMDVTERKKAEQMVTELNQDLERRITERTAQLEAANKELEAFSYSVSHDLRAPLRAIAGFSHILQDDYSKKLDDEGRRLLNIVQDNAYRMGHLIDDILKFSRSGRFEMKFSRIDMTDLARDVFSELRPSNGHLVQFDIEELPPSLGDHAMMRQVFVNLLSNAIKFTRNKEGGRIEVGSYAGENETIYFIKDNGAGFDMKYVDKLFGVFQRLHTEREFEGTGIGLALVKRIITRHGGRVWANGKINEGATVYFTMPTSVR